MRNRFDRQLEELNEMLIHMGELCETAIEEATGALEGHDIARAKAVITADSEIDQMEKEIENLCLKLLLQQQPVARDLRRISASLKMITDMERIGDQTADIADIVIATKSTEEKSLKDINRMAESTVKMVRDSVSAYVQKDLELARRVMAADDEVDDLFDLVKGDLVKFISDHKGNAGDEAIDLIMIAKYLERISDHAVNEFFLNVLVSQCLSSQLFEIENFNALVAQRLSKVIVFFLRDWQIWNVIEQQTVHRIWRNVFNFTTRPVQHNRLQLANFRSYMNWTWHNTVTPLFSYLTTFLI